MDIGLARKSLDDALSESYGWAAHHPVLREKVSAAVSVKSGRLGIEADEYCAIAAGSQSELLALIEEINASETRFFREPDQYQYLQLEIFPELIRDCPAGSRIRLWSAACSTGEEAYSLAIAFDQIRSERDAPQVDIFATDVRNRALLIASRATYSRASLSDLDDQTVSRYFESTGPHPHDGSRIVIPDIRRNVTFRRVNLFEKLLWKSLAGRFDLIVCANQLMYMNNMAARQLVGNLVNSLRSGGYLMVAPAEMSLVGAPHLVQLVACPSFFKKM